MIKNKDATRTTRAMTLIGAVALLALAGCNRNDPPQPRSDAPPANTAPGSASTAPGAVVQDAPGMTGTAVADTAVTAKVKAALLADPLVKGLAIDVETRDGVVSLTGKVSGAAERAKALELARAVEGVRSVNDSLSAMN